MSELVNTIAGKLDEIDRIKREIAKAITEKGGSVSTSDSFSSYPDKIRGLTIEANLGTLNVTENRTYYADSEGGVSGWSQVNVNISGLSGGSTGGGTSGDGSGILDEDGFTRAETFKVTFYEKEYGASNNKVFKEITVEKYDTIDVSETGKPIKTGGNGWKFIRWNPAPTDVTSDLSCYPIFHEKGAEIEDDWDEIVKNGGVEYDYGDFKTLSTGWVSFPNWKEYTSKSGQYYGNSNTWPYAIDGATNYTIRNVSSIKLKVVMEKTITDPGVSSTWVARTFILGSEGVATEPGYPGFTLDMKDKIIGIGMGADKWEGSQLQKWLNKEFFDALPEAVRNGIQPVIKHEKGYEENGAPSGSVALEPCKIWVTSYAEIFGNSSEYDYEATNYSSLKAKCCLPKADTKPGTNFSSRTLFRDSIPDSGYPGKFAGTDYSQNYEKLEGGAFVSYAVQCPRIGFCL